MSEAKFCRQCGRPISQGGSFCEACGTPVNASQGQTPNQPASQTLPDQPPGQGMSSQHVGAPAGTQHVQSGEKKKNGSPTLLLILIGLMMILFALRFPLLSIAGSQANAVVTGTRQLVRGNSSRMDNNYRVSYSFKAENGETYQSSYQMNKVFNISKLPRENSMVRIRYLPALPQISVPVSQGEKVLGIIGTGALGLFLIVLGFMGRGSGKKRSGRR